MNLKYVMYNWKTFICKPDCICWTTEVKFIRTERVRQELESGAVMWVHAKYASYLETWTLVLRPERLSVPKARVSIEQIRSRIVREEWNLFNILSGSRSWLRHYATSRKVAGSNPDEVDFFNWPNPSSCTMALGSTQSLTEMSTRKIPGG
jgi:hypothetical protein